MTRDVVLSLPNILTYGRILAVPAVAICFYFEGNTPRWIALGLFVVAAITDFFDGYLARAWQQQSALGRMLDPIADKLLVSVSLLVLAGDGTIGGWSMIAAIIILCREILVSGLREFLAELQVSVPVTKLAKWKTTVQLVAVAFLLAGPAGETVVPGTTLAGLIALWLAATLTLYTGYDYFRAGIGHLITE
ncbi:CDP-diacylglycerol--glycerol-3-phosphate 3-phosphatidyltransferase [Roseibium salinum]|uniref:CDP-diacylglycerol--glycerol-3-phosphate 3-phosphatidyltransferase n=1 Tax=Roseibium salinum TaxID=1604349 RepID=A0ABT3QXH5_9HYPH|nr:CDP-diacylglycerol--glycerol-3-phosphate 3-phosphatidyltransferase [Roseibium sp. DSM 29163]MCX2721650.1 CDP-diacylglycerol--glycerol-3-phosphate 3-phosphatidyltransferase [Roseibium sp. DSM 29163]MDN3720304.1 CDP-diacylglycerol--glycerol-3-phosphate 3-phosphatidyltransferase [Roseibium salinum]